MENFFGIIPLIGYQWLIDRGLVGFDAFSQLQPWHYMSQRECFWATERWPGVTEKRLVVFARRQDCDDLACFIVSPDNSVKGVALIHGWTGAGFDLIQEFPDFWEWLRHVVKDVAEWVESTGSAPD